MTNELNSYTELERTLDQNIESLNAPEPICDSIESILDFDGLQSAVGATPVVVSQHSSLITMGETNYYARVAREVTKKGQAVSMPFIVFDTSKIAKGSLPQQRAMYFKRYTDDVVLIVANELNPLINDPKYLQLASTIVNDIESQVAPLVSAEIKNRISTGQKLAGTFKRLRTYYTDKTKNSYGYQLGESRRLKTYGALILAALSYGHLGYSNADATIGPIPLPQPIELIVDINNSSDHDAQGFKEPVGATELSITNRTVSPKILGSYSTSGVPDAEFVSGNINNVRQESRRGMYEVGFTLPHEASAYEEYRLNDGCMPIFGDFTEGKTKIFTQTPDIDKKVVVKVIDQSTAEVCSVDGTAVEGSIFIYQK